MSISPMSDSPLIVEVKKKAKHLQSILKSQLPAISHGECLNILSRLERERDWNSYCVRLKQTVSDVSSSHEIDSYVKNIAMPLVVSIAAKHHMKVVFDLSNVEDGKAKLNRPTPRRFLMRIDPQHLDLGETYCEPFLDVSMTSFRFGCDWFHTSLNFVFPNDAFSVAAHLFSGNKICGDSEPQITRYEIQQQQCYMLTVNTSSVSDTVNHGLSIFTDQLTLKILTKELERFFAGYSRSVKAYSALQGKWGNKRLVTDFENALWKMNSDEPPYMAVSSRFYSTTIAGLSFHGELYSAGPSIVGADGSLQIGVCSIIYLNDGDDEKPEGYYIAKYGDSWQAEIHLKGFKEVDVDRITAEFGIPRGRFSEEETSFYQTPAFKGLCIWEANNPKHAKKVGKNGGRYLPDWYEQVIASKSGVTKKPTNHDFLSAIEKEPYLIDFGIRCGSHIDRKLSANENLEIFKSQRESFATTGYREFSLCCEWLHDCQKRKTINSSISSYRLKHLVEAWAKKAGYKDTYVSNGAFIAAAVHMGFDWKPDFDSPNVRFNVSGKSPAIALLKA